MKKLKGSRDASSVYVGGKEYPVKGGVVEVPDEHVAALERHGFHPVEDKPERQRDGK